ncbi:MAG: hypothetical protein KGJ93_03725 [Patescibacteria group bacterium]|nr:hypothetical protein [Patescibacteria group bacterium]
MNESQNSHHHDHCQQCHHGVWGMCCHDWRSRLLSWLLGLLVLCLAFSMGFKLGEFKGRYGSLWQNDYDNYGNFRMMQPAGGSGRMFYYNNGAQNNNALPPMMNYYYQQQAASSSAAKK